MYYHGNLTHFVEIHPEAKYYYELESSTLVFKFPTPERLDGIASTTRSVSTRTFVSYAVRLLDVVLILDVQAVCV